MVDNILEVREYVKLNPPATQRGVSAFFLFANGVSRLMFIPNAWGNNEVYFEWDGNIEPRDLEKAITREIPTVLGLSLTPEDILRSTTCVSHGTRKRDFDTFRERMREDPNQVFRFDVKDQMVPTDSQYSLAIGCVGRDVDPASLAFDSLEKPYSGEEVELLVPSSRINPDLIRWIAVHHMNPNGLEDSENIAAIINETLRSRAGVTSLTTQTSKV